MALRVSELAVEREPSRAPYRNVLGTRSKLGDRLLHTSCCRRWSVADSGGGSSSSSGSGSSSVVFGRLGPHRQRLVEHLGEVLHDLSESAQFALGNVTDLGQHAFKLGLGCCLL